MRSRGHRRFQAGQCPPGGDRGPRATASPGVAGTGSLHFCHSRVPGTVSLRRGHHLLRAAPPACGRWVWVSGTHPALTGVSLSLLVTAGLCGLLPGLRVLPWGPSAPPHRGLSHPSSSFCSPFPAVWPGPRRGVSGQHAPLLHQLAWSSRRPRAKVPLSMSSTWSLPQPTAPAGLLGEGTRQDSASIHASATAAVSGSSLQQRAPASGSRLPPFPPQPLLPRASPRGAERHL